MTNADKSLDIIQEAMKSVIAEFVLTLEDGSSHIVYIHDFSFDDDGKIEYSFSTLSKSRKDELVPHIEKIFEELAKQRQPELKPTKLPYFFKKHSK